MDFGLSEYPCSEADIREDLESLDGIFGVNRISGKKDDVDQTNKDRQESSN